MKVIKLLRILLKQSLLVVIFSSYFTHLSLSQDNSLSTNQSLSLWVENDSPSIKDKDYTSGVRIAYTQSIDEFNAFTRFLEPLTSIYNTSYSTNLGYSLTHMLFTPETPSSYTQPVGERRYAAWIGIQTALIGQSSKHQSVLGFTLGATGSPAMGEKIQDSIHDITKSAKFNGWDNEIPSEATLGLSWSHLQNIKLSERASITPGVILEAGNFRTQAIATLGIQYEIWGDTDPFTLPFVNSTGFITPSSMSKGHSLSLFSYFSEYFVAHDVTLDGSWFHNNDTGNTREPLVFRGSAGLKYQCANWLITLSYMETTDAYSTQRLPSKMANLNVTYSF